MVKTYRTIKKVGAQMDMLSIGMSETPSQTPPWRVTSLLGLALT